jgi:subtilisin family serine protease
MTNQRPYFAFRLALAMALILLPGFLQAQSAAPVTISSALLGKSDPWLKHHLVMEMNRHASSVGAGPAESLSLFVTGDPTRLPELISQAGGRIGSIIGSIATVRIPRGALEALAADDAIRRLELAMPIELDQDSVRRHVYADQALAGRPPLQRPVRGKGVIVGVIDTGIDFFHPEFIADDGTTRIISIWSQTDSAGPHPEGFSYGTEWRRPQLDDELHGTTRGAVRQIDDYGHGTHVTAIAAGRNGIAPESEIIMVQFHNSYEELTTDILDGAAYIYSRAAAAGKPCVINASLGTHNHFHDGSDAISRGLATLAGNAPGRIFVASAGNRGEQKWHWGGFAERKDSLWTYLSWSTVSMRIADSNAAGFEISIQVDSGEGREFPERLGQTAWRSVRAIGERAGFTDQIGGASITLTASSLDNGNIGVIIDVGSTNHLYRLLVRGNGRFDAWNPTFYVDPRIADIDLRYRAADSIMSIGSPGIASDVITVGSYVNRSSFKTASGMIYPQPVSESGARSTFSSIGPRSDGINKPDIVAPGENVISARSSAMDVSGWQALSDTLYTPNSGTSMSAPVVAGAVALYLELHPGATVEEVRQVIYRTARRDNQTTTGGTLPNGQWGTGKLDVYAMLAGVPVHTPDPLPPSGSDGRIWSQPLPATDHLMIGYSGAPATAGELAIYSRIGEEMARIEIAAGARPVELDVTTWASGIYNCRLIIDGRVVLGRFVVER